jgi:cleavage and polyadenylation specificity factor subunit 1
MSEMFSEEGESASSGSTLRRMSIVNGYSIVALNGASPGVLIKEASSSLKVVKLKGRSIRSIGGFHTGQCDRGIVSVDSEVSAFTYIMPNCSKASKGTLRLCQLPPQTRYGDTGWPTRKIPIGREVQNVCYFQPKGLYVISTCEKMEFKLPEDDNHKEWTAEGTMAKCTFGVISSLTSRRSDFSSSDKS